jgi:hypothetical protein
MQLVAYGAQDVYLTGNPQITFFKVVYRRHTNFSKECIEQTFSGAVGAGKRVSATLARNGDLVQEVYLKCTGQGAGDNTTAIDWVECEIGGQKIDKQYQAWLQIYNSLFETGHDYRLAMTKPVGAKTEVYIPLRFWFNRNPGLALPLIALQYHEVKINMQLSSTATNATDAMLLVNYLYLDTDERRRFAQVSHEYLIEQVQHTGLEVVDTGKITLNFNHPVKCLAWSSWNPLTSAKLQLNGHDRAAEQSGAYYQLVQPYESGLGHSNAVTVANDGAYGWGLPGDATNNVYLYSFALKPGEHQPSGTCNFSRIDNAVLQVSHNLGVGGAANVNQVSVHAVNYNVLRVMSGMGGLAYSN